MIDELKYNEIQERAAKGMVDLVVAHYCKASYGQMVLSAKYIVQDIVQAVAQAQVDCLSEGLKRSADV